jgi:hypothetical protein
MLLNKHRAFRGVTCYMRAGQPIDNQSNTTKQKGKRKEANQNPSGAGRTNFYGRCTHLCIPFFISFCNVL